MTALAHCTTITPELDATKSVTRNCHIDDAQRIHKNNNILDMIFYQKI